MKEGRISLKTMFLKINIPHSLTTYIMNYTHIIKIWTNYVPSCFDEKQHLTAPLLLVYVVQCPQTFFPSSYFECLGRLWWCASVFSCAKNFHFEKLYISCSHKVHISLTHKYVSSIFTINFMFSVPNLFQTPLIIFIHVL